MLEMCSGLPLALIVTAGLLAVKCAELPKSKMLGKELFSVPNKPYSTLQGMENIMHISYGDLSLPAKSCFLYLSAFPRNCTITKDHLIRRWVAEGFIPKINEETLWETGERYFNELICRRLIQPVFSYDDSQAVGCTVHDVIHDFVESLSCRENFVIVGENLRFENFPYDVIRRFCLDCSDRDEAGNLASSTVHLSRVRSLTVYGGTGVMLDLSACKLIRVLDLEGTKNLHYHQLASIGSLWLLRYLGLKGTDVSYLPEQVTALKHLAALDLRRTRVTFLPGHVNKKLVSLLADNLDRHEWLGISQKSFRNMHELEELSTISVGFSFSLGNAAELLHNSKQMRMLGLRFPTFFDNTEEMQQGVVALVNEVGKSRLQSLFLDDYPSVSLVSLLDCWAQIRPPHLNKFELKVSGSLSKVPRKMAFLEDLTHLHIRFAKVDVEGFRIIGNLPKLVLLKLTSGFPELQRCTAGDVGFQCLKVLVSDFSGMWLKFGPGAMPQLRRLRLSFGAARTKSLFGEFDFGIQHLSCLVQIRATINCLQATASDVEAAEASITEQVSRIPDNPVLILSREYEGKLKREEGQQSQVTIRSSIL